MAVKKRQRKKYAPQGLAATLDRGKLQALKDSGYTWIEIAKEYGISPETLKKQREKWKKEDMKTAETVPQETITDGLNTPDPVNDIADSAGLNPVSTPERTPEKPRATTKPWDSMNNPWGKDLLRLTKRRPGFTARFTTQDKLEAKLQQGWRIADKKDYGGMDFEIPGESGKGSTLVKRRELFLVEMPNELAEQRKAFYERKADRGLDTAKQIAARQAAQVEKTVRQRNESYQSGFSANY